jgi:hypothetical protein
MTALQRPKGATRSADSLGEWLTPRQLGLCRRIALGLGTGRTKREPPRKFMIFLRGALSSRYSRFSKFFSVLLKGIGTRNIPRHLAMILPNIGSLRL